MAVSRVSLSSITQGFPKSRSFLDGNSAYMPSSYESISTVTVGAGGSSSISFTSIPSTYKHLQVRMLSRSTRGAATADAWFQINSDTGSNYAHHDLSGNGSAASAGNSSGTTNIYYCFTIANIPASTATSGIFGGQVLDILDYASTSKYKTTRMLGGFDANGSGSVYLSSGLWQSTSAINSLTFYTISNWAQYTQFALYGVKG